MDGILRGAAAQASEESDRFISSAVRSNLFRTVFALAVMEYAVGVSKFGQNPMTLLVHQY